MPRRCRIRIAPKSKRMARSRGESPGAYHGRRWSISTARWRTSGSAACATRPSGGRAAGPIASSFSVARSRIAGSTSPRSFSRAATAGSSGVGWVAGCVVAGIPAGVVTGCAMPARAQAIIATKRIRLFARNFACVRFANSARHVLVGIVEKNSDVQEWPQRPARIATTLISKRSRFDVCHL